MGRMGRKAEDIRGRRRAEAEGIAWRRMGKQSEEQRGRQSGKEEIKRA